MPGTVSHAKKHRINSIKDHTPILGDHDENAIVVMDSQGLPVKDSGIQLSSLFTDEPKQAIGLYVSYDRGDDTLGDGSLFNPFKTIQKAVDYAYTTYPGEAIDIFIRTIYPPVGTENVEIHPGMTVSLKNEMNYTNNINLTVNQFCWVAIINLNINNLIENDDGDAKYIHITDGYIDNVVPTTIPSIDLELHGTYIANGYTTILSNVNAIYGWWIEYTTSGVVIGQPGEPDQDKHLVNLGYLETNIEGKVKIRETDDISNYLSSKLVAGEGIQLTLVTVGFTDTMVVESAYHKSDIALAGETPVDTDVVSWANGDRGHGIGTTGREFYMVKRGTTVKYVELS